MSVSSCVASLMSSVLDCYDWLDTRFDLADFQQHYEHVLPHLRRAGQSWATVAGLAFPVARLPNQIHAPAPAAVTREVSIDVKRDRDGLFVAVVRDDVTGELIVVSPPVDDVPGSISAARHMYQTGDLFWPEQPAPVLGDRTGVEPAFRYV